MPAPRYGLPSRVRLEVIEAGARERLEAAMQHMDSVWALEDAARTEAAMLASEEAEAAFDAASDEWLEVAGIVASAEEA